MAENYILEKIDQHKQIVARVAYISKEQSQTSVWDKILNGTIAVGNTRKDVNIQIEKANRVKVTEIEANIRQNRLKEANQMKKELEEKLDNINQTIMSIEDSKNPSPDLRKSRKSPEQLERLNQAEEFTKRLALERRARLKRQQDKNRIEREKMIKSMEVEVIKRQEIEKQLEQRHRDRILRHRPMGESPQPRQQIVRQKTVQLRPKKPMYKQIEDSYAQNVMLPELERRKAEIQQKRSIQDSVKTDAIEEHQRKYEATLKERAIRREKIKNINLKNQNVFTASNPYPSKFTYDFLAREKEEKEKRRHKEEERKILRFKQEKYGEIVRDMYTPNILNPNRNPDGRLSRSVAPSKIHTIKSTKSLNEYRKQNESMDAESQSSFMTYKSRKFKPNPMIPRREPPREPHVVDYLAEQKRQRKEPSPMKVEKKDWSGELKRGVTKENLKSRIRQMEIIAQRQELALSEQGNRGHSVDVEENVNDVIIESIKAKLALLDDITED